MTHTHNTNATTANPSLYSTTVEDFGVAVRRHMRTIVDLWGNTAAAQHQHNRHALLRLVHALWIKGVLEPSQQKMPRLTLKLVDVQDPVNQSTTFPVTPQNAGFTVTTLLQQVQYPLVIVGESGSGKTTTLLELTRQLLLAAYHDPNQPLPVVLPLSTWAQSTMTLAEWIVAELYSMYQIPKAIAIEWIKRNELALLLDGLDEVAIPQRANCLAAINAFIEQHKTPVVVCCQTAVYEQLSGRLDVQRVVMLQPLTAAEVTDYLGSLGSEFDVLRSRLQISGNTLVSTPLQLQLMAGLYRNTASADLDPVRLQQITTAQVVDDYAQSVAEHSHRYSTATVTRWLSWLAKRMQIESQSLVAVKDLQPSWLPQRWQQWLYVYLSRTVVTVLILFPIFFLWAGYFLAFDIRQQPLALLTGTSDLLQNTGYILVFMFVAGLLGSLIDLLRLEQERRYNNWGKVLVLSFLWTYVANTLMIVGPLILLITLLTISSLHMNVLLPVLFTAVGGVILLGITLGVIFWFINGPRLIGNEIQFTRRTRMAGRTILAGTAVGCTFFLLLTLVISGSAALVAHAYQDDPLEYITSAWNIVHVMIAMLLLLAFIGWRTARIDVIPMQISSSKSIKQALKSSLLALLLLPLGFTLSLIAVGSLIGVWFNAVIFMMGLGQFLGLLLSLILAPLVFLRYGGFALIQHLILRMIFGTAGYLPARLVTFLDYCAESGLLYQVGDRYIFINPAMQENYAVRDKMDAIL